MQSLIVTHFLPFSRAQHDVGGLRSGLHVRRAAPAGVRDHPGQEPGHGGRPKAQVCDATTAGAARRNEEDVVCQLYRNLQNAPSTAEAFAGLFARRVGYERFRRRQLPAHHQGPLPAEADRERAAAVHQGVRDVPHLPLARNHPPEGHPAVLPAVRVVRVAMLGR
uniref:(northern house mosquito) hypothetical protein n=1 Tax=Culex pipiens TaxID=7175 RepID=A0A8D8C003_CULPI